MARQDRIDAEAREIVAQVFSRLAELRELRARGRLGRLDADLGRSQGHYSKVLQRKRWRDLTEQERNRRLRLAIGEASRILGGLDLDAKEYFRKFFDFDLDLYLRRLELKMEHQARSLKGRLRRAEPMAGGLEEIRRRVAKLEEERLLDQAATEEDCCAVLKALEGEDAPECEAEAWGVLAAILRKRGVYSGAAFALRSALENARASGQWLAGARTLERASYLLADQGDLEFGIGQARAAYLIYAEELDFPGMGRALVDLGGLLGKSGVSDAAIRHFEAALKCLPKSDWVNRFAAMQGLGLDHVKCGRLREGSRFLDQALRASRPQRTPVASSGERHPMASG